MLLTDIFAGLSVLSLFILVLHGDKISAPRKAAAVCVHRLRRQPPTAPRSAVLLGLCCARLDRAAVAARDESPSPALLQGSLTIVAGAAMLLAANFALSGQLAWTPGGYRRRVRPHDAGRHRRTAICATHCPQQKLKLCPYRNQLPATADEFLWGNSMFNTLGRFEGLTTRWASSSLHSLAEYPAWQAEAAIVATAQQLTDVATGEGTNGWIPHTYGIIERYHPGAARADARGASTALGHQFRGDQLDPCPGGAGIDAG